MELLGEPAAAADAIREFAAEGRWHGHLGEKEDPAYESILDYFRGTLETSELMTRVADDPGRRCEYSFFAALRRLGRGDREDGLDLLRTCIHTGVFIFSEYRFAQAMLARAEEESNWPRWVRRPSPSP